MSLRSQLLAAAACHAALVGTSLAETVPGTSELDEIVVTGTKQALTVQETDVSVELFTPERLDAELIFTLDDLLLRTPNVSQFGVTSNISIRGIARSGVGNAGEGITSNVYLDGAPLATQALSFGFDSLWDVAQVEVLRGPQSTVQGRNALAGAIVINTNDPTYAWEGQARLRAEERGGRQLSLAVSGPLIEDQLAFRLAVDHQSRDGIVDQAGTTLDLDDASNLLLRGKLLAEPAAVPALRAELTVDYNSSDIGRASAFVVAPVPATDPAFPGFDFTQGESFGPPQSSDVETVRLIGDVAYGLSDGLTLRAIGTYEDTRRDRLQGSPEEPGLYSFNATNDDRTETVSGELRLEYDGSRVSGFAGAYYFEDDQSFSSDFFVSLADQVFFPIDPADTILGGNLATENATENWAVYAQARAALTDRLTLDLGARYDEESFETTGSTVGAPVVDPESCTAQVPGFVLGLPDPAVTLPCLNVVLLVAPPTSGTQQGATFDAFLSRGALTYDVAEGLSVFAAAQRGYRAGGTFIQQTSVDGAPVTRVGTFEPEFLTNYEIGFRSVSPDGRLTLNANAFYSDLTDQQVFIPGPSGNFLDGEVVNAGESRIYGLEVTGDFDVTEGLEVYGSLGLLDAEFEDFPFAAPGSPFENLSDAELPQAPSLTFTVGATYTHASGGFADLSLAHTGPSEAGLENLGEAELEAAGLTGLTERLDARSFLNGRVGFETERFTAYLYARNILDEDDVQFVNLASVDTTDGSINVFDEPSQTLTEPRTFGVGVDVRF
jgi:outer membrane receptor protein involved in Fe transport